MKGMLKFDVPVHFEFASSELRETDRPVLDRFASVVKEYYPGALVTVEGFTDPAGSAAYNQRLGQRRADAVKEYLATAGGFTSETLKAVSYGEVRKRQVVPGAKGPGDAGVENRRVALVIDHAAIATDQGGDAVATVVDAPPISPACRAERWCADPPARRFRPLYSASRLALSLPLREFLRAGAPRRRPGNSTVPSPGACREPPPMREPPGLEPDDQPGQVRRAAAALTRCSVSAVCMPAVPARHDRGGGAGGGTGRAGLAPRRRMISIDLRRSSAPRPASAGALTTSQRPGSRNSSSGTSSA